MDQNYSNKIVSLHLERCGLSNCPHQSICYLRNRKDEKRIIDIDIEYFLKKGYRVFDAVCNTISNTKLNLLIKYPNYNLTMSYSLFKQYVFSNKHIDQIQVTIYNENQLKELTDWNKIFLIKDQESLQFFKSHWNIPYKNIHYAIYKEFINKNVLEDIIVLTASSNSYNVSFDSCLYQTIRHNKCTYNENYIDINYDGTVRKCPYDKEGIYVGDKVEDMEKIFDVDMSRSCIYQTIFGENNEEQRNTDI